MYFHCVPTMGSPFEIVMNNADLISMKRPLLASENVGGLILCNYMADFMYIN
mgnify:CR=1 FL=1